MTNISTYLIDSGIGCSEWFQGTSILRKNIQTTVNTTGVFVTVRRFHGQYVDSETDTMTALGLRLRRTVKRTRRWNE